MFLQTQFYGELGQHWRLKSGYVLLGVFVLVTVFIHFVLLNSAKNSPQAFIRYFMGATMAKFLLYLSVLIGFLVFSTENQKAVVLHFLFYYAVFTVFEVSMLYGDLRKMK